MDRYRELRILLAQTEPLFRQFYDDGVLHAAVPLRRKLIAVARAAMVARKEVLDIRNSVRGTRLHKRRPRHRDPVTL